MTDLAIGNLEKLICVPHIGGGAPLIDAFVPRMGPDGSDDGEGDERFESGTLVRPRPRTKRPSLYRVLLINDDYTPQDFVVVVLREYFNKSPDEAMQIMLHVHNQGVGECGIFPFEVAETKVARVMHAARKNQHPLQCVMERQ